MLYFVKVWIFKGDWGSIMLVSKACLKTVSCVNIDLILSCTLNELTPFIYTFYSHTVQMKHKMQGKTLIKSL